MQDLSRFAALAFAIGTTGALAFNIIAHNAVTTIPQNVGDDSVFRLYQPFLKIDEGCVPFAAVNAQGDVSGGLEADGLSGKSGCDEPTNSQVYVRLGTHSGPDAKQGLMYAWFFPKEQPAFSAQGHRYGWQYVVVWLHSALDPTPLAISYSSYGKWKHAEHYTTRPNHPLRPLVAKIFLAITPEVSGAFSSYNGFGEQPLVLWDSLPGFAKATLEAFNFDGNPCFLNQANFQNEIDAAWTELGL